MNMEKVVGSPLAVTDSTLSINVGDFYILLTIHLETSV